MLLLLLPLLSIIYSISECVWVQISSVQSHQGVRQLGELGRPSPLAEDALKHPRAATRGDRSVGRVKFFGLFVCFVVVIYTSAISSKCWASMVMVSLVMLGVATSPFSSISTGSGSCKFQVSIKGTKTCLFVQNNHTSCLWFPNIFMPCWHVFKHSKRWDNEHIDHLEIEHSVYNLGSNRFSAIKCTPPAS